MSSINPDASASTPSNSVPSDQPLSQTPKQSADAVQTDAPKPTVEETPSAPETSLVAPATSPIETATAPPLASSPSQSSKNELAVRISLLLPTGNRHPFTVNNRFLQRHNIQATDSDPWNIRVYDMKSLIWHEWLSEWESRPTSPAAIRLIFLGGLLDDKAALKDCRFSKTESNVVHMTVKPQDLAEDDEVKGKEQNAGSARQSRTSNCCVIL